ncbi:MAG: hypothetical protein NTU47_16320 [Ignavibacteriales bacterium]|nr:hypothetical protein [Ignavibacteriales bacterium]
MDVTRITKGGLPIEPLKSKKVKEEDKREVGSKEDRVELSDQAISLFTASQMKRYDEIQQRVDSGYYFQRDVSEKVVDAMLRDLKMQ